MERKQSLKILDALCQQLYLKETIFCIRNPLNSNWINKIKATKANTRGRPFFDCSQAVYSNNSRPSLPFMHLGGPIGKRNNNHDTSNTVEKQNVHVIIQQKAFESRLKPCFNITFFMYFSERAHVVNSISFILRFI